MSAQAGIVNFDGDGVPPSATTTLARALLPYGPDGGGEMAPVPGVWLASRRLDVALEDRFDTQPLSVDGGRWLTWDGRLDNRDDLALELSVERSTRRSDGQLAAQALGRWGDAAWPRLVGDWSAALCDPRSREIVLASDYMGVRPLYYVVTGRCCAWSTALEGLVGLTARDTDLDDEYLLAYVMNCRPPGRTPYRGIRSVRAGHWIRLGPEGTTERAFWSLPENTIRYGDARDYAVQLRQLFATSVANRLRSQRPVWLELSGGWDSSAIVCMAARLAESGAVSAPALHTVSYVAPMDPEVDETRFIEAVETHTGLPALHIALDREAPRTFPNPTHVRFIDASRLTRYEAMRSAGARVLTSGRLGDGVMGNFPFEASSIANAIRTLAPGRVIDEVRSWSKASGRTAWDLLHEALLQFLPLRVDVEAKLREVVGGSLRQHETSCGDAAGHRVRRAIVSQHVRWVREQIRPLVSREFVGALALYSFNRELSSPPEVPAVNLTYPLADRRLVEYLASIPGPVVCATGQPRALMRAALGPLLPARVARRFSKGYAAPYAARRLRAQASPLLARIDELISVRRGYVDPGVLRRRLEQLRDGVGTVSGLEAVVALESWLEIRGASRTAAA